ncbi:MAG: sensor domain-containing diguanylate cyclase [Zoogloea sp.]|uniref:sensor domain-containing diguanylate cyclase n=1 Tax=Zoogloea sp. TaxID=49181 RepID=UPI0026234579|nr:sensor domain-containing diguanylate cyclase [Zoogloea sp.]MDD2987491.1 sensor domain-containing diguanylate cyclase [Zoogloea sp.]
MTFPPGAALPSAEDLLSIIRVQTEIARLGLDLDAVMGLAATASMELTTADGAAVEIVEGPLMVYRAAAGAALSQLGIGIDAEHSLSGLCVRSGSPLSCDDAESDPRVDLTACRKVGLRAMAVVPLRYDKDTVGVLKVMSRRPAAFGHRELEILKLLADLLAASMYFAARCGNDALFHRATHDMLTGLANRALFLDRLRNALLQADRENNQTGVLMVDMDELKQINDRLGHRVGDIAIREFAQRLANGARRSDTVARLGGDEFGVVLSPTASTDGLQASTTRLEQQVHGPLRVDGHEINLGASFGAALYPDDASDIESLLDKADQAMYATKRTRKSTRPGAPLPDANGI